ncbi:MAG: 4'-phosphopantetheinyl transferase superfamily protein [Acidobacteria bacterium]|nr:4'-phosphopantetheinyl transferase superfamily protein [Acidobacteriota bacterium]
MDGVLAAWPLPPEPIDIKAEEVHVWGVELNQPEPIIQDSFHVLAQDERRRAESFFFVRDRVRFTIARGVLRKVLSRYLLCRPDLIRFDYGPEGKPALCRSHGSSLEFNASHSNDLALYAITRGRDIGVDVEHLREDLAGEQIARQFFSARELAELHSLPSGVWTQGFFNCWTRKEAYIKAIGKGLSQSLSSFSVSLEPGIPPALTWIEGNTAEAESWALREIVIDASYAAAVAMRGNVWTMKRWRWFE